MTERMPDTHFQGIPVGVAVEHSAIDGAVTLVRPEEVSKDGTGIDRRVEIIGRIGKRLVDVVASWHMTDDIAGAGHEDKPIAHELTLQAQAVSLNFRILQTCQIL